MHHLFSSVFTDVTCLGLWYVDRTIRGLLSCQVICATHPLVPNMTSSRCIRSLLFRVSDSPLMIPLNVPTKLTPHCSLFSRADMTGKKFQFGKSMVVDIYVTQTQPSPITKRKLRVKPVCLFSLNIYQLANKSSSIIIQAPNFFFIHA